MLLTKAALLQGAHALDSHSDTKRDQVIEIQPVWFFKFIEQILNPPKFSVHDTEE